MTGFFLKGFGRALVVLAGFSLVDAFANSQDEQQIAVVCLSTVSLSGFGIECGENSKLLVDAESLEMPFESYKVKGLARKFGHPTVFTVSSEPSESKLKYLAMEVVETLNQVVERVCRDGGFKTPSGQVFLRGRYMSEGAVNTDFGSGYVKGRWTWNKEKEPLSLGHVRCSTVVAKPDPTVN